MARIDSLLLGMYEHKASDLHMVVGQKPKYRIDGDVRLVEDHDVLTADSLADYLFEICDEQQRQRYVESMDFDFAYGIEDKARYRCNYFFQRTGYGAVMRLIPTEIMTLEALRLPKVLTRLTELRPQMKWRA